MSATELYHKSTQSAWRYKLVFWKGANGCTIVALGAILSGLANENWSQMDGQSRFLFVCGIALSTLKSLDMLFDQTLTRIQSTPQTTQPQPTGMTALQQGVIPSNQKLV